MADEKRTHFTILEFKQVLSAQLKRHLDRVADTMLSLRKAEVPEWHMSPTYGEANVSTTVGSNTDLPMSGRGPEPHAPSDICPMCGNEDVPGKCQCFGKAELPKGVPNVVRNMANFLARKDGHKNAAAAGNVSDEPINVKQLNSHFQHASKLLDQAKTKKDELDKAVGWRGSQKAAGGNEGHAYVIHGTRKGIKAGKSPKQAFEESAENENFHGNSPDVVADRASIAGKLKHHFKIDVDKAEADKTDKPSPEARGVQWKYIHEDEGHDKDPHKDCPLCDVKSAKKDELDKADKYNHYVVDHSGDIHGGFEYKQDAHDLANDMSEGSEPKMKVMHHSKVAPAVKEAYHRTNKIMSKLHKAEDYELDKAEPHRLEWKSENESCDMGKGEGALYRIEAKGEKFSLSRSKMTKAGKEMKKEELSLHESREDAKFHGNVHYNKMRKDELDKSEALQIFKSEHCRGCGNYAKYCQCYGAATTMGELSKAEKMEAGGKQTPAGGHASGLSPMGHASKGEDAFGKVPTIDNVHKNPMMRKSIAWSSKKEELKKPFVSEAQRRWGHTAEGEKALGGKAGVHEWDESTKGKKLPERKMELGSSAMPAAGLPDGQSSMGGSFKAEALYRAGTQKYESVLQAELEECAKAVLFGKTADDCFTISCQKNELGKWDYTAKSEKTGKSSALCQSLDAAKEECHKSELWIDEMKEGIRDERLKEQDGKPQDHSKMPPSDPGKEPMMNTGEGMTAEIAVKPETGGNDHHNEPAKGPLGEKIESQQYVSRPGAKTATTKPAKPEGGPSVEKGEMLKSKQNNNLPHPKPKDTGMSEQEMKVRAAVSDSKIKAAFGGIKKADHSKYPVNPGASSGTAKVANRMDAKPWPLKDIKTAQHNQAWKEQERANAKESAKTKKDEVVGEMELPDPATNNKVAPNPVVHKEGIEPPQDKPNPENREGMKLPPQDAAKVEKAGAYLSPSVGRGAGYGAGKFPPKPAVAKPAVKGEMNLGHRKFGKEEVAKAGMAVPEAKAGSPKVGGMPKSEDNMKDVERKAPKMEACKICNTKAHLSGGLCGPCYVEGKSGRVSTAKKAERPGEENDVRRSVHGTARSVPMTEGGTVHDRDFPDEAAPEDSVSHPPLGHSAGQLRGKKASPLLRRSGQRRDLHMAEYCPKCEMKDEAGMCKCLGKEELGKVYMTPARGKGYGPGKFPPKSAPVQKAGAYLSPSVGRGAGYGPGKFPPKPAAPKPVSKAELAMIEKAWGGPVGANSWGKVKYSEVRTPSPGGEPTHFVHGGEHWTKYHNGIRRQKGQAPRKNMDHLPPDTEVHAESKHVVKA